MEKKKRSVNILVTLRISLTNKSAIDREYIDKYEHVYELLWYEPLCAHMVKVMDRHVSTRPARLKKSGPIQSHKSKKFPLNGKFPMFQLVHSFPISHLPSIFL